MEPIDPAEKLLRSAFYIRDEEAFKKLLQNLKEKYSEWPEKIILEEEEEPKDDIDMDDPELDSVAE